MDLVLITIACPRLLGVGLEKDGALLRAWLCLSIFIYLFIYLLIALYHVVSGY
jgi:hypothetical protein